MSRRRNATLSELDGDGYDLLEVEVGTWDYTAGLPRLGGSKDETLRPFYGVKDQCGTCHQRLDDCEWRNGPRTGPHPR